MSTIDDANDCSSSKALADHDGVRRGLLSPATAASLANESVPDIASDVMTLRGGMGPKRKAKKKKEESSSDESDPPANRRPLASGGAAQRAQVVGGRRVATRSQTRLASTPTASSAGNAGASGFQAAPGNDPPSQPSAVGQQGHMPSNPLVVSSPPAPPPQAPQSTMGRAVASGAHEQVLSSPPVPGASTSSAAMAALPKTTRRQVVPDSDASSPILPPASSPLPASHTAAAPTSAPAQSLLSGAALSPGAVLPAAAPTSAPVSHPADVLSPAAAPHPVAASLRKDTSRVIPDSDDSDPLFPLEDSEPQAQSGSPESQEIIQSSRRGARRVLGSSPPSDNPESQPKSSSDSPEAIQASRRPARRVLSPSPPPDDPDTHPEPSPESPANPQTAKTTTGAPVKKVVRILSDSDSADDAESKDKAAQEPFKTPAKTPSKLTSRKSDKASVDSDGVSLSPSPPRKRNRLMPALSARDRYRTLTQADIDSLLDGTPLPARSRKSTAKIWNEFDSHNKAKVEKALGGLSLDATMHFVTVKPKTSGLFYSLDTLLTLPIARNYVPSVKPWTMKIQGPGSLTKSQWSLEARDPSSNDVQILTRLYTDDYTNAESTILCGEMVNIFNRWPGPTNLIAKRPAGYNTTPTTGKMLLQACRIRHFPTKPIICHLPRFRNADSRRGCRMVVNPRFAEPPTYAFHMYQKEVTPTTVRNMPDIPDLPGRYEFIEFSNQGTVMVRVAKESPSPGQPPEFASMIPSTNDDDVQLNDNQRQALRKAERLCRYFTASLAAHGGLMDRSFANHLWQTLLEKFGGSARNNMDQETLLFQNKKLFTIAYQENTTISIVIAKHVVPTLQAEQPDFQPGQFPSITIRSSNRAWAKPSEQAISSIWASEGDLLHAWTRGAEIADEINQAIRDGDRPSNKCTCTADMVNVVTHSCAHCGRDCVCSTLVQSKWDGLRVCAPCEARRRDWKGTDKVTYELDRQARRAVRNDMMKSGLNVSDKVIDEMTAGIVSYVHNVLPTSQEVEAAGMVPGLTFRDQYTGQLHSMETDSGSGNRTYPERPSLDATFPAWWTAAGYRIHVAGNVRVTTLAANYVKHTQIPAFLHTLCWFVRKMDSILAKYQGDDVHGAEAMKEINNHHVDMIRKCHHLRNIRLIFGWTIKGRISARAANADKFQHDLETMISGRTREDMPAGPWTRSNKEYIASLDSDLRMDWPEPEIARVHRLVHEILDYFGVRHDFRQGSDGCYFFGHPACIPPNWSLEKAIALMAERLMRMIVWCNRFWTTYDHPADIYLEAMFQAAINRCVLTRNDPNFEVKKSLKTKYASSILALPIGIAFHDALRMAVAHAEHGKGMRTGWPVGATTLQERLDNDDANNIRIEACTENYLKSDFDPSTYPKLKEIVLNIDLPKDVFDRQLVPKPEKYQEDWIDLDWDQDYYGMNANVAEDVFDEEQIEDEDESGQDEPGQEAPAPEGKGKGKMVARSPSAEADVMEVDDSAVSALRVQYDELLEAAENHPSKPLNSADFRQLTEQLHSAMTRGDSEAFQSGLGMAYDELK
ncbi:hypothetical protein K4K59_006247 [Colletotrichum sp. SAR11_240]|nr:hypothetical protein K4K59_006247 [Colletotrichum sp. SAR11_240]